MFDITISFIFMLYSLLLSINYYSIVHYRYDIDYRYRGIAYFRVAAPRVFSIKQSTKSRTPYRTDNDPRIVRCLYSPQGRSGSEGRAKPKYDSHAGFAESRSDRSAVERAAASETNYGFSGRH